MRIVKCDSTTTRNLSWVKGMAAHDSDRHHSNSDLIGLGATILLTADMSDNKTVRLDEATDTLISILQMVSEQRGEDKKSKKELVEKSVQTLMEVLGK